MTSQWWDYLDNLRGDSMSDRQLANFIEVTPATVSRWKAGKRPGAAEVVGAARAFGANAVDALVAGGVLGENEASRYRSGQLSLADVPLAALLSELETRMRNLRVMDSTRSIEKAVNNHIAERFFQ